MRMSSTASRPLASPDSFSALASAQAGVGAEWAMVFFWAAIQRCSRGVKEPSCLTAKPPVALNPGVLAFGSIFICAGDALT
jgi:hypothetical protein